MAARKSVLFASPARTTTMPVWVRDAKEVPVRKPAQPTTSSKPMLDLYEVRESILEQIRNKDALPLRRIRGRIDKSSAKDNPVNCDLLDLSCSNRSHTSEVPRTLSRRFGPRRLSVYEHRPGVGDVSAGDMDGCDQASETTTSAFPLPSPPLPPPPPPPAEFTETDLKYPLKASSAYAHLSPTAATTTTTSTPASVNLARRPGLHQLADSFQNTLRIQKNTARGFKEVSFCSARQSYDSPKSQPPIEVSSRCSPPLSGNDKKYSSRAASSFTSYQTDKTEVPERRVPVRLHDERSAKPMTIRKSVDPCSPLRIQDSAYPSSVAASSSERGHTEDLPASRTRAYSQYEVRQQPTAGVSRSLRSNALGGQGVDLQQDSAQKFNQSPLVYDFHRYGREITSDSAAERESKYPEKKRTSVDKDRFPEADYPTLKSVGTEFKGIDEEHLRKGAEDSGFEGAIPRRPVNRVDSKFNPIIHPSSEIKTIPAAARSLHFAEVEEGNLQGDSTPVKYTSTLLERVPHTRNGTTVAAEHPSRQPRTYFSLPRQKRLPLDERDRMTLVQEKPPERKPPSIRYSIPSNADRFNDLVPQFNSPMSKEDSGVQTGLEDDGVNTHSQHVLSGSSAWRSRSSTLPLFHASSVGTEAYLTTPESLVLESDCLKSTWSFPRHSIYEEKLIRQMEAPTEHSNVMPLAAGRPICPPHHYTGLGMFQGLAPKILRSNSRSSDRKLSSWQNRSDERSLGDIHTHSKVRSYSPNYSCPLEPTPAYATPSPSSHDGIIPRSRNRSECHRPLRSGPALRPHRMEEVPCPSGQFKDFHVGMTPSNPAVTASTRREHQRAYDSEVQETQRSVITQTCGPTHEQRHKQVSHPTWLRPEPLGGSGLEPRRFGGAPSDETESPPLRRYLQRQGSLRLRPARAVERPLLPNMSYAERFVHPSGPSLFID